MESRRSRSKKKSSQSKQDIQQLLPIKDVFKTLEDNARRLELDFSALDFLLYNEQYREKLRHSKKLRERYAKNYQSMIETFTSLLVSRSRHFFCAIPEAEILCNKGPKLTEYSENFDNLSLYIKLNILENNSLVYCVLAIERWIDILIKCMECKDFYSAFSIISALNNSALNKIKDFVSAEKIDIFENTTKLFSARDSYQVLRESSKEDCIPYLGAYTFKFTMVKSEVELGTKEDFEQIKNFVSTCLSEFIENYENHMHLDLTELMKQLNLLEEALRIDAQKNSILLAKLLNEFDAERNEVNVKTTQLNSEKSSDNLKLDLLAFVKLINKLELKRNKLIKENMAHERHKAPSLLTIFINQLNLRCKKEVKKNFEQHSSTRALMNSILKMQSYQSTLLTAEIPALVKHEYLVLKLNQLIIKEDLVEKPSPVIQSQIKKKTKKSRKGKEKESTSESTDEYSAASTFVEKSSEPTETESDKTENDRSTEMISGVTASFIKHDTLLYNRAHEILCRNNATEQNLLLPIHKISQKILPPQPFTQLKPFQAYSDKIQEIQAMLRKNINLSIADIKRNKAIENILRKLSTLQRVNDKLHYLNEKIKKFEESIPPLKSQRLARKTKARRIARREFIINILTDLKKALLMKQMSQPFNKRVISPAERKLLHRSAQFRRDSLLEALNLAQADPMKPSQTALQSSSSEPVFTSSKEQRALSQLFKKVESKMASSSTRIKKRCYNTLSKSATSD